jgi:hypothetical protein
MKLELNKSEVYQVKDLIYDKIDEIGGFDRLSDELKAVLNKMSEE